jgi:hypothetical protein
VLRSVVLLLDAQQLEVVNDAPTYLGKRLDVKL